MRHDQFLKILQKGSTTIPNFIFDNYHKIGIDDIEFLVIMKIYSYCNKSTSIFDPSEINSTLAMDINEFMKIIKKLVKKNIIIIESKKDDHGVIVDIISLDPFFKQVYKFVQDEPKKTDFNIEQMIENEFARLLTPIEIECISSWREDYDDLLIIEALKEASKNNVRNLKYIDAILIDWKRRNINCYEDYKMLRTGKK